MLVEPRRATFMAAWAAYLLDRCVPSPDEQREVLARVGIDPLLLRERDGRLAYDAAIELWSLLTERHPDDTFGLKLAAETPPGALGVLGYLAASSDSLGSALGRIVSFERLLKDPDQLALRADTDGVHIIELPPPGKATWPRHLSEAVLMTYVVLARRWTGEELVPRRVRFQHAPPSSRAAHERLFGCPVEFAAPVNELVLPPDALELPLCNADATLAAYLEDIATELVAALPPEDALLERLRRAIVELLPEGPPTLERTSRRLGLGGRTLQRRLVERGLKYHTLVDEVRQASAERLLSRAELSVAQVAFLVGFSDPSGFRRAHRRWTQRAPRRS
jgi:AraC-like DNA-binding protein